MNTKLFLGQLRRRGSTDGSFEIVPSRKHARVQEMPARPREFAPVEIVDDQPAKPETPDFLKMLIASASAGARGSDAGSRVSGRPPVRKLPAPQPRRRGTDNLGFRGHS